VPQPDVAFPKWYCSFLSGGLRGCVLSHSKEIEECNCDQVGDCVKMGSPSVVVCYGRDGGYWQGELRLWGWVVVSVMLD
jgi:hypothetical protein